MRARRVGRQFRTNFGERADLMQVFVCTVLAAGHFVISTRRVRFA
jgi:hypothetical protein